MKRPESVDSLSLNAKIEDAIKNLDTLNEMVDYIGGNSEDVIKLYKSNFVESPITNTKKITDNYIVPMKQLCPFKKRVTFSYNTNYGDKRFLTNQTECFEYCDKEYCMGWDEINERCRLIIKNDT